MEVDGQLGEDLILLRFPKGLFCERCNKRAKALALRNVPVFDDHGCILGIDTEVRFMECSHLVVDAYADPVAVAGWMNEMAS